MSLQFREEILEFSLFKLDNTSRDQLQYVLLPTLAPIQVNQPLQRHIPPYPLVLGLSSHAPPLLENLLGRKHPA
jgi:hypothetical protein